MLHQCAEMARIPSKSNIEDPDSCLQIGMCQADQMYSMSVPLYLVDMMWISGGLNVIRSPSVIHLKVFVGMVL